MYQPPAQIGTTLHEDDIVAILARLDRLGLPRNPIAFYGSSSFRLWPSITQDLGSLDIVNLGFGGGSCASGLHYFDKLLLPSGARKIALYFGENDIASDGLTAETTFAGLRTLRARIAVAMPGATVWVLETKQSPARWIWADEVTRYNALAEDWCAGEKATHFVRTCAGLIGENGRPISRCYMPDFIHLNAAGYAVWTKVLRDVPGLLQD